MDMKWKKKLSIGCCTTNNNILQKLNPSHLDANILWSSKPAVQRKKIPLLMHSGLSYHYESVKIILPLMRFWEIEFSVLSVNFLCKRRHLRSLTAGEKGVKLFICGANLNRIVVPLKMTLSGSNEFRWIVMALDRKSLLGSHLMHMFSISTCGGDRWTLISALSSWSLHWLASLHNVCL